MITSENKEKKNNEWQSSKAKALQYGRERIWRNFGASYKPPNIIFHRFQL